MHIEAGWVLIRMCQSFTAEMLNTVDIMHARCEVCILLIFVTCARIGYIDQQYRI